MQHMHNVGYITQTVPLKRHYQLHKDKVMLFFKLFSQHICILNDQAKEKYRVWADEVLQMRWLKSMKTRTTVMPLLSFAVFWILFIFLHKNPQNVTCGL